MEKRFNISTEGEMDLVDITRKVSKVVKKSGIRNGICLVFSTGSTGAIFLNEFESRLMKDFKEVMKEIIEREGYEHPDNARSHLRTILVGNSEAIPIKNNKLQLGTWEQIIFCNFDTRPREREVVVKLVGD